MASRWLRTSSSSALNCWEMCWVRLSLLIIGSLRESCRLGWPWCARRTLRIIRWMVFAGGCWARRRNADSTSSTASSADAVQRPLAWPSAVAAGDVVLGLLHLRVGEQRIGISELDQFAHVHEGGVIRHPRRLLHVVG